MQKADFSAAEPSAEQKKKTEDLIRRLHSSPEIDGLLKQNQIPASYVDQSPWKFHAWMQETEVCRNCRGLKECRQKSRGFFNDLTYDGTILKIVCTSCRYQRKQNRELEHVHWYLINDLTPDLLKVSFEDINVSKENSAYLQAVKTAMQAVQTGTGLYLYGNMGTGKTYLAACASNFAARQGKTAAFIHYPSFTQRMRQNPATGEYRQEMQRLCAASFLVIDDIGAENMTAWNRDEILLPVLNQRMEKKMTTWFTTNEDFRSLENHFSMTASGREEQLKAMRIMERIRTLSKPLEIIGKDRRSSS